MITNRFRQMRRFTIFEKSVESIDDNSTVLGQKRGNPIVLGHASIFLRGKFLMVEIHKARTRLTAQSESFGAGETRGFGGEPTP